MYNGLKFLYQIAQQNTSFQYFLKIHKKNVGFLIFYFKLFHSENSIQKRIQSLFIPPYSIASKYKKEIQMNIIIIYSPQKYYFINGVPYAITTLTSRNFIDLKHYLTISMLKE